MADFIDISDWYVQEWVTTTGTREKCFIENPANYKLYFFKESIKKFTDEYWSEIIASKVGKVLGFNILDYNIAKHNSRFGCICELMIDQTSEELEHGINLIKNAFPDFKITHRPSISYQQATYALSKYNSNYVNNFVEIMVFDALIGNQDRHSENWALIRSLDMSNKKSNMTRLKRFLINQYRRSGLSLKDVPLKKYLINMMSQSQLINYRFSPIYDSGSSLGRELNESTVNEFLNSETALLRYIKKGKSEITFLEEKVNHFELLNKIRATNPYVEKCISNIKLKWNEEMIREIVFNIDSNLPLRHHENVLPLYRKKLIFNLLKQRYLMLSGLGQ